DVDTERVEVREHPRRQVVQPITDGIRLPFRLAHPRWEGVGSHLARVRPRGVEDGPAGALDRSRVDPIERPDVVRIEVLADAQVREALPATPDPEHGMPDLRGAIDDALDDGVQAGNVATAGQDGD